MNPADLTRATENRYCQTCGQDDCDCGFCLECGNLKENCTCAALNMCAVAEMLK